MTEQEVRQQSAATHPEVASPEATPAMQKVASFLGWLKEKCGEKIRELFDLGWDD